MANAFQRLMQAKDDARSPPDKDPEVLNLTNEHLANLESINVLPTLKLVDLTCNRLQSIDPRILALTGLVTFSMRQNLLTDTAAIGGAAFKDTLEDMEFRDNQLTQIPDLSGFGHLTRLEFSYNEIRSMDSLATLPPGTPLCELYLAQNKVPAITSALSALTALTTLELGSNRIRAIENLDCQGQLRELWLGRNRIAKLENLSHLTNLRRISVQSNRLESCLGLEACVSLEELYLSHNGIKQLEGLGALHQLRILDVSANLITKVQGLEGLTQLEDLWLNDNNIPDLDEELAQALQPVAASLTTVYFENNPAAKAPSYKLRMKQLLPNLKQLDANYL